MSRSPSRLVLVAGLACAAQTLACKSEQVDEVTLQFRPTDAGLSGFDCTEEPQLLLPLNTTELTGRVAAPQLANRLVKACAGPASVSIVVDFVRLGGAPRCDTSSLVDWCTKNDCSPIPELRRCFQHDVTASPGQGATDAVTQAILGLAGQPLTARAPGEFVVVRAVAVGGTCDTLMGSPSPQFSCKAVVGCASSCPVKLDEYSGPLPIALDLGFIGVPGSGDRLGGSGSDRVADTAREYACAQGARACARVPFGPVGQCAESDLGRPACDPR